MELVLTRQSETRINITCDNQSSHSFDLPPLLLEDEKGEVELLNNPVTYGKAIYAALFPSNTPAKRALESAPERILLVTNDNDLDRIPWEFVYGYYGSEASEDFLVLDCHLVRGLPAGQRIAPPTLDNRLHIIAVPSSPLSSDLDPLNIDDEWIRLKEIIQELPYAITLERTRPPTLERLRHLVANQQNRILHFMGHGAQHGSEGAILYFEQENGDLEKVTAKDLMRRLRGTVFLVALNTCMSAKPGPTDFNNMAAGLVRQKVPYALGMQFNIADDDALAFSRIFYSELAQGISVEEALLQTRLTLAKSTRCWAIGLPVLYTALSAPASGCTRMPGTPVVLEHQPKIEVNALPRAEGIFQGRVNELIRLGDFLTGDSRPSLVTIHGAGGQGKTALAREAVERFAWAWPGGVWATFLENLSTRELFVNDLARFLTIDTQKLVHPDEIERLVIDQLSRRRTLIVLDNAETLIEAVETKNEEAIHLAQFLRERLPKSSVSLLTTSRSFLGWTNETGFELEGLTALEGVRLFKQHVPQRQDQIDHVLAWNLSEKVGGHPLSLRLLGGAFNAGTVPFSVFIEEYEAFLLRAEDSYKNVDHRQRTLYASIDTSVRYLETDVFQLFSRLWLFHGPFLVDSAIAILDPDFDPAKGERSPIFDQIYRLWLRGLLVLERQVLREGEFVYCWLLPIMRTYIEQYLARPEEREQLLAQFGTVYAGLVRFLYDELSHGGPVAPIAILCREDLDRGTSLVTGVARGQYLLDWGWVLHRLGYTKRGLELSEEAFEIGQEHDQTLEMRALSIMATLHKAIGQPGRALEFYKRALLITRMEGNLAREATILANMADVYRATGRLDQALELFEQVLPIRREVKDREGEAATLNNMAGTFYASGQLERALELYEQALELMRELGNRAGEASTLNNMALVYDARGQLGRALELYEQALPLREEVRDRAGALTTMNNMGEIYRQIGQPGRALELFEMALPILREIEDRAGEAAVLNNIGEIYRTAGQLERALESYKQALSLMREVENRAGEASTLNNMALAYQAMEHSEHALELFQQVLQINREVGDRAGEAGTLTNIAGVYHITKQSEKALDLYEQALPILREVENRLAEAAALTNLALLLYQFFNRRQDAIDAMQQSIAILDETGLPQDAAGNTRDVKQQLLDAMRKGIALGQADQAETMPREQLWVIVSNTVAVMTTMPERLDEWSRVINNELQRAKQRGVTWQIEVDFYSAVLDILNNKSPILSVEHPYAQAIGAIYEGIETRGIEVQNDTVLEDDDLPFDPNLIQRSIAALLGEPQKKMAYAQYLAKLAAKTTNDEHKVLLQAIQLALFGADLSKIEPNLSGVFKEVWEAIVVGVEIGGSGLRMFNMIVQNTLNVLGPDAENRGKWRDSLVQLKNQLTEDGAEDIISLLDAVVGLLDANGNPAGLGMNLTGIYEQTWQVIIKRLRDG